VFEGCDGFLEVVAAGALAMAFLRRVAETYRLGFEERAYSYSPTGLPRPVCANVVDSEICLG
jgi:hypothetical protein